MSGKHPIGRTRHATALTLAILAGIGAAASPAGAFGDAFWARHRQEHPKCMSWIDRHEQLTHQLNNEAEGLRHTGTQAERTAISTRLNSLSQQRSEQMAGLQDCIRINYGYQQTFELDAQHNQAGLTAMTGDTTYNGAPIHVDLAAGHFVGDRIDAPLSGHPTYNRVWGTLISESQLQVTRLRDMSGKVSNVKFIVPIGPK